MSYIKVEKETIGRIVLFNKDKGGVDSRPSMQGYFERPDGTRYNIDLWDQPSNSPRILGGKFFKGNVTKEKTK